MINLSTKLLHKAANRARKSEAKNDYTNKQILLKPTNFLKKKQV